MSLLPASPVVLKRVALGAVLLGIGLRVAAVLATPVFPTVANTWDSNFYHETATSLAGGEGYTFQGKPTAYYPPAFPAALSLVYRVTGPSARAGQLLNVALSLALLAAMAGLAGCLAGPRTAWITALLLAVEPSQIVMPAFLMSETLCGATLAGALACLARRAAGGGLLWLGGAALLGAAAGLARGHAFLVPPVAVAALLGWGSFSAARARTALVVVLAGLCVTVGLWAARNDRRLGKPVPVATNTGINLLLGNNPNARGARADPPGGVPQTGDEIADEDIATRRALDYIRAEPGRFVLLLPVKAFRLLAPAPAVTYRAELGEKWSPAAALAVSALAQLAHGVLIVLAGIFLWRARGAARGSGERALGRLLVGVFLIWTVGHLPFLGGARYAFPVHALLAAGAAGWLARAPGARLSDSAP